MAVRAGTDSIVFGVSFLLHSLEGLVRGVAVGLSLNANDGETCSADAW